MSLVIRNTITDNQRQWLRDHGYYGNFNLSREAAEQLITELIEQERLEKTKAERDYFKLIKRING